MQSFEMKYCGHCGLHHGPICYRIKAIEYHPDGSVKRVEYIEPIPAAPISPTAPSPLNPWIVTYGIAKPAEYIFLYQD